MSQSLGRHRDTAQAQAELAQLRALLQNVPEEQADQQDAQYTLPGPRAVIMSCVFILF
jgi:hypothetical protein